MVLDEGFIEFQRHHTNQAFHKSAIISRNVTRLIGGLNYHTSR